MGVEELLLELQMLLAMGMIAYNTNWLAIQRCFLPSKSVHQVSPSLASLHPEIASSVVALVIVWWECFFAFKPLPVPCSSDQATTTTTTFYVSVYLCRYLSSKRIEVVLDF